MDLKIGFWNLNNKDCTSIARYIVDLLSSKDLDLLFLSEYGNIEGSFESSYLPSTHVVLKNPPNCKKVMTVMKSGLDFKLKTGESRFLVISSSKCDCKIIGLHLPSDFTDNKARFEREEVLRRALEASQGVEAKNEIFVGDFNCMPYDDELTTKFGMHVVLFKEEMKSNRGKNKKHYNPILLELNETNKVYGSFKYSSNSCPLYWHAFDQVVVGDTLVNSISDLAYLKSIAGKNLMSKNNSKPKVSDHLPLVFTIKGV